MTSASQQSRSFVVDVWLSVSEPDRDIVREGFERLLASLGSTEQAEPVMLAMPSIAEEPPPGGEASAVRLRWVDIGGANAIDAAGQVTELLRRISQLLPALASGEFQCRSYTEGLG